MSDEEFIAAFETCQLPRELWKHKAHVRMAWIYLSRHPFAIALEKARSGIRRYNISVASRGYRETETVFFMHLIASKLRRERGGRAGKEPAAPLSFEEFCSAHADLFDGSSPPRKKFYSEELWRSERSADEFLPPDLSPIPDPGIAVDRALERLKGLAQTGLAYTENPFDRARYEQVDELARELASRLTGWSERDVATTWIKEEGYATPRIDVRGVAFRDSKVLLVREKADGKWTLPGGWADIGDSPGECAIREIGEETGYEARALRLLAVYDRDRHPHPKMLLHVYKIFFLCEITGGHPRSSLETYESGFFGPDELPELSTPRVTRSQILRCFEHLANPGLPADFD